MYSTTRDHSSIVHHRLCLFQVHPLCHLLHHSSLKMQTAQSCQLLFQVSNRKWFVIITIIHIMLLLYLSSHEVCVMLVLLIIMSWCSCSCSTDS